MAVSLRGIMQIVAFSNQTGSRWWRLESVSNYITGRTSHEMFVFDSNEFNGDILDADVVIGQMWKNPEVVREVKKRAKFILEVDDLMIDIQDRKNLQFTPEDYENFRQCVELADAVTTTTPYLVEFYKQFNPNVYLLPNYMDMIWWGQPTDVQRYGKEIRVGWMGGTSHHEDLQEFAQVIKRIIEEFPQTRFVYCGYGSASTGSRYMDAQKNPDIFSMIPRERQEFVNGVPIEFWPAKSKALHLDIGVAPLIDDQFNKGKSPIKWMEYAGNGVPCVVQDMEPYQGVFEHGVEGFLAKTPEDWYQHIKTLILDEELRRSMAIAAYQKLIENYTIDEHFQEYVDVYQKVVNG